MYTYDLRNYIDVILNVGYSFPRWNVNKMLDC